MAGAFDELKNNAYSAAQEKAWQDLVHLDSKSIARNSLASYDGRAFELTVLDEAVKVDKWEGVVTSTRPHDRFFDILIMHYLVGCQSIESLRRAPDKSSIGWLKHHVQAVGPECWILRRPRRLLTPVHYKGRQGIFDVELDLLGGADWEPQCRVCGCTELDACRGGCYWLDENLCSRCNLGHHVSA